MLLGPCGSPRPEVTVPHFRPSRGRRGLPYPPRSRTSRPQKMPGPSVHDPTAIVGGKCRRTTAPRGRAQSRCLTRSVQKSLIRPGLAAFSSRGAPRLSSSNLASAASTSASSFGSNTVDQGPLRPSEVRSSPLVHRSRLARCQVRDNGEQPIRRRSEGRQTRCGRWRSGV